MRGLLALLVGRAGCGIPHGDALPETGRRVRHRPNDLIVTEGGGQRLRCRPGEHREHDLAAAEPRPDLASDTDEHLWLDAEQYDMGRIHCVDVVGNDADAVLRAELIPALGARMAGDDLVGSDELTTEQTGDHRLGHHPRADGGDRAFAQRSHPPEYRTRSDDGRTGFAAYGAQRLGG